MGNLNQNNIIQIQMNKLTATGIAIAATFAQTSFGLQLIDLMEGNDQVQNSALHKAGHTDETYLAQTMNANDNAWIATGYTSGDILDPQLLMATQAENFVVEAPEDGCVADI